MCFKQMFCSFYCRVSAGKYRFGNRDQLGGQVGKPLAAERVRSGRCVGPGGLGVRCDSSSGAADAASVGSGTGRCAAERFFVFPNFSSVGFESIACTDVPSSSSCSSDASGEHAPRTSDAPPMAPAAPRRIRLFSCSRPSLSPLLRMSNSSVRYTEAQLCRFCRCTAVGARHDCRFLCHIAPNKPR